jgi:hypothetical protein
MHSYATPDREEDKDSLLPKGLVCGQKDIFGITIMECGTGCGDKCKIIIQKAMTGDKREMIKERENAIAVKIELNLLHVAHHIEKVFAGNIYSRRSGQIII